MDKVKVSKVEVNSMLAVVLMVKNEEQTIKATLKPLIEGGLHHFFIFDTGSTDNTLAVSKNTLASAGVDYHCVQEPFIDFAVSRNRALILAEEAFSSVPFLLMPDAEWHLHQVEQLLYFCKQQEQGTTSVFLIRVVMNHSLDFYTARLFRTKSHIRFSGAVHEYPLAPAGGKIPEEIYFTYQQTPFSREKSAARWKRDLTLLLKEYGEGASLMPRNLFYLAQTFECLENWREAYHYYKLRSEVLGWDEENFITLFRLGRTCEKLSTLDTHYSWEQAQDYYLQAFALRPQRIEPLIRIADHYWPEQIPLCYLYAHYACEVPYPANDILFIEKHLYQYTRYEILSRCAWHMGKFKEGLWATEQALKAQPNVPHLLSNLKLYQERCKELVTI